MRKATVYLDSDLHRLLRIKSMATRRAISEIVNEAVRVALQEDVEDLIAVEKRKNEMPITYGTFLQELKARVKA